jgi:hypothetical protein
MSGVKGRSGRKSRSDEKKRLDIIDRAWDLVRDKLHSDDKNRYDIARDIVLRDITQKVKGEGFDSKGTDIYQIIQQIQRDIPADRITPVGVDTRNGLDKRRA